VDQTLLLPFLVNFSILKNNFQLKEKSSVGDAILKVSLVMEIMKIDILLAWFIALLLMECFLQR